MADTQETIADIIAEMRRGTRLPGYWRSCDVNEILQYHADRIEAAAKRAYNDIDSIVCGIEGISHYDIDDVRKAMEKTIGDYYE